MRTGVTDTHAVLIARRGTGEVEQKSSPFVRVAVLPLMASAERLGQLLGRYLVVPGVDERLFGWSALDSETLQVGLDPFHKAVEIHVTSSVPSGLVLTI
jgi:hypothetical protein